MSQEIENKDKVAKNLRYQRDKDREEVEGIFRYYEVPGGAFEFVYKAYKGDEVRKYSFVDGYTYKIPLGVAKHLNKNGWYPEYSYVTKDAVLGNAVTGVVPTGNHVPHSSQLMKITKKVHRFGFQSMEFIDPQDLPSTHAVSLVSAEQV